MNGIYLDVQDRFFRGKPLAGKETITVRVVYFNEGYGEWELRYDAVSNSNKIALAIRNSNTGRWEEATVMLDDAHFGNRSTGQRPFAREHQWQSKCFPHG